MMEQSARLSIYPSLPMSPRLFSLAIATAILLLPTAVFAAVSNCASGVLVSDPCTNIESFSTYLNHFLDQNLPLILFTALVLIVYSGVQYVLLGAVPEGQKAAKQRILGVLGGLVFYLLIKLILNQLAPGLTP